MHVIIKLKREISFSTLCFCFYSHLPSFYFFISIFSLLYLFKYFGLFWLRERMVIFGIWWWSIIDPIYSVKVHENLHFSKIQIKNKSKVWCALIIAIEIVFACFFIYKPLHQMPFKAISLCNKSKQNKTIQHSKIYLKA